MFVYIHVERDSATDVEQDVQYSISCLAILVTGYHSVQMHAQYIP